MSNDSRQEALPRWERGASRVIASTKVLDLCGVQYRHPKRGTQREFVSLAAPDWVNVVAVTTEDEIVLVRQFRFGTNDFSLETPGGVMEAGEDPVTAGMRELAEETGYAGGQAKLIASVHPNPAIQGNTCHAVLALGVSATRALAWDPDEEIEMLVADREQVRAWIAEGRIKHSLSLCALFYYLSQAG